GLWESAQVMEPLIEEYQQQNPHVTINYEQRPIANHYTTVKSRLSSTSATGAIPDIVRLHNTWIPVLVNQLSALPDSVQTNATYEQNQYPVTKDSLFYGGQYYGLPLTMDGLALVY